LWSPGGQTTSSITVYQPGNYVLQVTDTNGCILASDPFLVSQSDSLVGVVLLGDSIICERDTVWLNPLVTGYSSYVWMPGSISTVNLPVSQSGSYALVATDSSGCIVKSDTVNITVLDSPTASVTSNGVLCQDSTLVLRGVVGMNAYQWAPGNETTQDITINGPGVYSLVVTDTNGCESLTFPYSVNEIVVPVEITNTTFGFCEGDSIVLIANSGMREYLWLPSGDTNSSLTLTEPGLVTLSVVDTNGCIAQVGPVSVTKSTQQTEITGYSDTEICEGDTVVLMSDVTGLLSYEWMPGNQNSNSIIVTTSGTFWFTAIDSAGCILKSDSVQIQVIENDLLPPSVVADSVVCLGANILFIADGGGNDVYWYDVDSSLISQGDSLYQQIFSFTTILVQTVEAPCSSAFGFVNIATDDCEKPDVPNVFTPNGDGVNDGWFLEIFGETCYEVKIYNRWGILIYTLEESGQRWNGIIAKSEKEAPDGVYYYILNYCDFEEIEHSQTGHITLIR
jgi:gliding motility-associated-like protein